MIEAELVKFYWRHADAEHERLLLSLDADICEAKLEMSGMYDDSTSRHDRELMALKLLSLERLKKECVRWHLSERRWECRTLKGNWRGKVWRILNFMLKRSRAWFHEGRLDRVKNSRERRRFVKKYDRILKRFEKERKCRI